MDVTLRALYCRLKMKRLLRLIYVRFVQLYCLMIMLSSKSLMSMLMHSGVCNGKKTALLMSAREFWISSQRR